MRETIKDASCLHNDASRARAANPNQFDWLLSSSLVSHPSSTMTHETPARSIVIIGYVLTKTSNR